LLPEIALVASISISVYYLSSKNRENYLALIYTQEEQVVHSIEDAIELGLMDYVISTRLTNLRNYSFFKGAILYSKNKEATYTIPEDSDNTIQNDELLALVAKDLERGGSDRIRHFEDKSFKQLDYAVLEDLRRTVKHRTKMVVENYMQTAHDLVAQLKDAVAREDYMAIGAKAHQLRAPSGQVGALSLAKICSELEMCANNEKQNTPLEYYQELYNSVDTKFAKVKTELVGFHATLV